MAGLPLSGETMAVTLTPNLKLKVDSTLSANSRFNLYKIDDLASLYQVNANSVARIRSRTDIVLQPQDPDIGGTGAGGSVSIGTVDQPVTDVNICATSINVDAPFTSNSDLATTGSLLLKNGDYSVGLTAPTLSASYSLTLPTADGTANQVLSTDGSGQLSWVSISGVSIGQELSTTWSAGDGLTKTITHGFGTQKVIVQVLDATDDYRTVEVDEVTRPNSNQVTLSSSFTPTNWVVLLKEIP